MTIGELARRFDLRPSALRFYERHSLLAAPLRVAGKRCYDDAAVRRLGFIRAGQNSGLTLRELKVMIEDGMAGISPRRLWNDAAPRKLALIDQKISTLEASRVALRRKLACRCRTLKQCERLLAMESESQRGAK